MTLTRLILWMHEDFRGRLAVMDGIARKGGIGEDAELAHELSLLLKVLEAHEWVEEEVLHPALREHALDAAQKIAAGNKAGHRVLHQKIVELEEALSRPEASLTLLLAAESFIVLLRRHMAEEEAGILALADKSLPADALESLGTAALARLKEADLPLGSLPSG